MKKLTLALLLATACSNTNPAAIMVKAQAPKADCVDYGDKGGVSLTRCVVVDEKTKEEYQYVAAYSAKHPFQVWQLKTPDQIKKEAEAYAKAQKEAEEAAAEVPAAKGSGAATK